MPYQSGINYIDTLLSDAEPHWEGDGSYNTPTVVSYSFVESRDAYNDPTNLSPGVSPIDDFSPFTDDQRAAAREIFDDWASVANITFQEVPDSLDSHGDIRLLNSNDILDEGAAGLAYLPVLNAGEDRQSLDNEVAGDILIAPASDGTLDVSEFGFGRFVLAHEIGHALGLTHPDSSDSLGHIPAFENNNRYTIMTTPETSGDPFVFGNDVYVGVPMLYDIAAIQHLYTANTATNSDDTVYTFGNPSITIETIWDGGGNDTLDASNSTESADINLNPGTFSSLGDIPGPFSPVEAVDNVAIAYNTDIENAYGSRYDDTIIGNSLNNALKGMDGSDYLYGGAGDDVLDGGQFSWSIFHTRDVLEGGSGDDTYYVYTDYSVAQKPVSQVIEQADEGIDTVYSGFDYSLGSNVENLVLTDTSIAIEATGNGLSNTITGNSENNLIAGRGGNDILYGQNGDDVLDGGPGNDILDGGEDFSRYDDIFSTFREYYSDDYYLNEYTAGGALVSSIPVLYPEAVRPYTEEMRDILISDDNTAYIVDGFIHPYLTVLSLEDGASYSMTLPGWSYLGNDGGSIVKIDNFVFVNDFESSGSLDNPLHGIIRFDLNTGEGTRFLDDTYYYDMARGPDDALYAHSGTSIDAYDPHTMEFLSSTTLDTYVDKIAVAADGEIYGIETHDVYGFNGNGTLASSFHLDGETARDLTVDDNGHVVVSTLSREIVILDPDLTAVVSDFSTSNYSLLQSVSTGGPGLQTGDTVNYEEAFAAVAVDLGSGTATGGGGTDTLTGIENISGSIFGDVLTGDDGRNVLYGGGGNDVLDGGIGPDIMIGGAGDDMYYGMTESGDTVMEDPGGGTDTVNSLISLSLSGTGGLGNVENLNLLGGDNIDGSGNGFDNVIHGNTGDNRLSGLGGSDVLYGGYGADMLFGGGSSDLLEGGYGTDSLFGGGGSDFLDGGYGADMMTGGAGDDTYYVDAFGDSVAEDKGGGMDHVFSTAISYNMAANVEDLTLLEGDSVYNAFGNGSNNSITGNSNANSLYGRAGNDSLSGMAGNDWLEGGGGRDTLLGGDGHDRLDGGSGLDVMIGGAGEDNYYVNRGDGAGIAIDDGGDDLVIEDPGAGYDYVHSSVYTYTLPENVEFLYLEGDYALKGFGNDGKNVLLGNDLDNLLGGGDGIDTLYGEGGDDNLQGGNGNDVLQGGTGVDFLTGGAGIDSFVFSDLDAVDWVTDFSGRGGDGDALQLYPVFTGLGSTNQVLNADEFVAGAGPSAADDNDHILYDTLSGALYYDPDGSGAADMVQFADLSGAPDLHNYDFLVVS